MYHNSNENKTAGGSERTQEAEERYRSFLERSSFIPSIDYENRLPMRLDDNPLQSASSFKRGAYSDYNNYDNDCSWERSPLRNDNADFLRSDCTASRENRQFYHDRENDFCGRRYDNASFYNGRRGPDPVPIYENRSRNAYKGSQSVREAPRRQMPETHRYLSSYNPYFSPAHDNRRRSDEMAHRSRHSFQQTRDDNFLQPHDVNFQKPRDVNFQPPCDFNFQQPRDNNFLQPHDVNFQQPHDVNFPPPHDVNFQPPRDVNIQQPHNVSIQQPQDQDKILFPKRSYKHERVVRISDDDEEPIKKKTLAIKVPIVSGATPAAQNSMDVEIQVDNGQPVAVLKFIDEKTKTDVENILNRNAHAAEGQNNRTEEEEEEKEEKEEEEKEEEGKEREEEEEQSTVAPSTCSLSEVETKEEEQSTVAPSTSSSLVVEVKEEKAEVEERQNNRDIPLRSSEETDLIKASCNNLIMGLTPDIRGQITLVQLLANIAKIMGTDTVMYLTNLLQTTGSMELLRRDDLGPGAKINRMHILATKEYIRDTYNKLILILTKLRGVHKNIVRQAIECDASVFEKVCAAQAACVKYMKRAICLIEKLLSTDSKNTTRERIRARLFKIDAITTLDWADLRRKYRNNCLTKR